MKKNPSTHLLEILLLAKNIRKFVDKSTKQEMLKNHMMCTAVLMELTIIGEKSKKISSEIKKKIDLPWKNIAGFRDVAVHDYSKIDNNVVVGIVFDRLDELEFKIKKYLKIK